MDLKQLIAKKDRDIAILRDALKNIAQWNLPETGLYYDEEKTKPMSYEAAYGTNGSRRYITNMATEALLQTDKNK